MFKKKGFRKLNRIHIGNMILKYCYSYPMSKRTLAGKLDRSPATTQNILKHSSVQTDFLIEVSELLNHDFFADFSNELKLSTPSGWVLEKEKLLDENKQLRDENAHLRQLLDTFNMLLKKQVPERI